MIYAFFKKKKEEEPRSRGDRFTVNHKTLLFTCVIPSVSFCSEIWFAVDNLLTKHDPEFASMIHGFNKKKCISRNIKC